MNTSKTLTSKTVRVVFDIESNPPMPLGLYERTDEDVVIYLNPTGRFAQAPADCVTVISVDPVSPQPQVTA
jgi:hypothetical protein